MTELEALIDAVRALQPARANDVSDWLGRSVASVSADLKDLEKRGTVRRDGEYWSVRRDDTRRRAPAKDPVSPPASAVAHPAPTDPPPPVAAAGEPAPRPRGRPKGSVKGALLEQHRELVGALMDHEVARRLEMSVETVRRWRIEQGIPAAARRPLHGRDTIAPAVADEAGGAPAAVPAKDEQGAEPGPKDEAASPGAPRRGTDRAALTTVRLFTVRVGETDETIVASDIGEAATLAVQAFGRDVSRIEFVRQALRARP